MKVSRDDLVLWRYRSDFAAFNRFAFRELHPGVTLRDNWHITLMADRLEKCARGEIRRLIINVPPRSLKSHAASVAFPLWVLGRDPLRKIMTIAGTRSLVADLSGSSDRLLRSARLRAIFPHLMPGQKPGVLELPDGGRRMPVLAGNSQIGRGADMIIIDDPMPAEVAKDEKARTEVNRWFDGEVIQRLNDKTNGVVIVVMQRLHPDDLTGHLLAGPEPWEKLVLPAIALEDECWSLPDGRVIQRRRGEALSPQTEDKDQLRDRLMQIGAGNFTAQYLQAPRLYAEPDEKRSGAFQVDSGHGYPTMVFHRVPEVNYLRQEIFGDKDVFAPPRPRPLMDEEKAAAMIHAEENRRAMEEWVRREITNNPSRGGPRTLPPGVFYPEDLDSDDHGD